MTKAVQTDGPAAGTAGSGQDGIVSLDERSLSVRLDGQERRFHYVWLRDNSWAPADRVFLSSERRLFTASIPDGIAPAETSFDPEAGLHVRWNDGQRAHYSSQWLRRYDYSDKPRSRRRHCVALWGAEVLRGEHKPLAAQLPAETEEDA